jgi:hypothetical protein
MAVSGTLRQMYSRLNSLGSMQDSGRAHYTLATPVANMLVIRGPNA